MDDVEMVSRQDESGPARPRVVTVLGRIWLIGGIVYLAIDILDLIVWVALGPAMPTILGYAQEKEPALRFLRPYFDHYGAIKSGEAIFAAAVVLFAFEFLKLRGWARAALETAAWVYLLYVLAFLCVSFVLLRHAPFTRAAASSPYAAGRLAGGLGMGLFLAAGLIWMISVLRGKKVRAAFAVPSG